MNLKIAIIYIYIYIYILHISTFPKRRVLKVSTGAGSYPQARVFRNSTYPEHNPAIPMGPCSYMVYTWTLKKFRCP